MTTTTTIAFVRHGMVENPRQIIYGRLPRFRLSAEGRTDARRAAMALRDTPLDAVYSSPLLRARQTATELLRYHPELRLHVSSLITEVHTPFEGKPQSSLADVEDDVYSHSLSSGERPETILARTRRFIQRVGRKHSGGHIAVVSHGDVILFLLLHAAGYAPSAKNKCQLARLPRIAEYPATGSITTFIYDRKSKEISDYSYTHPTDNAIINE